MQHFFPSMLCACMLLTACHNASTTSNIVSMAQHGDTVVIFSDSPLRSNLKLDTICEEAFSSSFSAFGVVRAEAGKMAEVAVPMDGRTGECFVHPGSKVRAGQSLFSFYSAEFADIVRAWFEARANNELAAHNLARKESLKHDGVVSERELEETRNEAELARRSLRQAEQSLSVLGVDTARLQNEGELHIIAPISGEVMRCEVTNGQFVRADDEALITIADLSSVWVTAQVKEQYIRSVHSDDRVTVTADAYPDLLFEGSIIYIGGLVDESTRAIDVIIRVENQEQNLKPGMYVRTAFSASEQSAMIIPATAIMQAEEPFVYVALNDSSFVHRQVAIRSVDANRVEVLSGLHTDEIIISKGGFYLAQ